MEDGKYGMASPAGILRVAYCLGLALSMLPIVPSRAEAVLAQEKCRKIGGFDVCGRFLEEWSRQSSDQGDVYVNGLPITRRHPEINYADGKPYDTQWFERARFEAHPENKAPYDMLFGLLGVSLTEGRGTLDPATGRVRSPSDAAFGKIAMPGDVGPNKLYFPETGHSVSGKILEYWSRYGGLKQFGFPVSEPFDEISPTKGVTYTVQYFERNRFELHPEKQAPYEVQLGLLGAQQYKQQNVAADDLPIAPPKGITSAKDKLVMATFQEPGSLFNLEEGTATASRHAEMVTFNDAIVGTDEKGDYFPLAAWYVPTIENGGAYFVGSGPDRHLVVKYRLRPGVKWSDGVELTSADAIFAYKFILADGNADPSAYLRLESLDNPDKYTVLYNYMSNNQVKAKYDDPRTDKMTYDWARVFLRTGKPVVSVAYVLIGTVLPQHVLSKVDPGKVQDDLFARKPVGYGPFMVDHWTQGVEMLLVQNPNYSLTDKPLLKQIRIKEGYIALDSAYQQVNVGDIDAVAGEAIRTLPSNASDLKANGVVFNVIPSASVERLDLYFDFPPFKDRAVRQAMIQAIDRRHIVDVVFQGTARALNGVVPPAAGTSLENLNYTANYPDLAAKYKLPAYPYDPSAANKLLDNAGWLKGTDGIRAREGQKLRFDFWTAPNSTRIAIQSLVGDYLKNIGIEAELRRYCYYCWDPPTAPIICKVCDVVVIQGSLADFSNWDETMIRDNDYAPWRPNFQHYRNHTVTAANQAFISDADPRVQAEASAQAQVALMEDIASIPIAQLPQIEIYTSSLQNRKVTSTSAPQTWNVTQWYFK